MKAVKYFFVFISLICTLSLNSIYSQLGNQNMYLIANRNDHPPSGGSLYSAIWGYRAPNGREYAILGCRNGTSFYDVTDSANVFEADFIPGSNNNWREMKVFSHYAYIVSELTGSGLLIVDLNYLPDSVHIVRTFTYSGYNHTHSIQQDGPYLYLNGGNVTSGMSDPGGVRIIDLTSNPKIPRLEAAGGVNMFMTAE
jgi:choice-of-anchor B domain-containing protein